MTLQPVLTIERVYLPSISISEPILFINKRDQNWVTCFYLPSLNPNLKEEITKYKHVKLKGI